MCDRCDDLAAEVAYLRSELGLTLAADERADLQRAFGLTPNDARFLLALYHANGSTRTHAQLLDAVPAKDSADDERVSKMTSVYASRVRRVAGKGVMENVWGEGYRLTPAGLAQVRAALERRLAA